MWTKGLKEDIKLVGFEQLGEFIEVIKKPYENANTQQDKTKAHVEAKKAIEKIIESSRKYNTKMKAKAKNIMTRERKIATKPQPSDQDEITRREQQIEEIKEKRWKFIDSKHFHIKGSDRTHKVEMQEFCENTGSLTADLLASFHGNLNRTLQKTKKNEVVAIRF